MLCSSNLYLASLSLLSSLPQFLLSCSKLTWSLVKGVRGYQCYQSGVTSGVWLEFRWASLLKWCPKKFWYCNLRKSPIYLQVDSPESHSFPVCACVCLFVAVVISVYCVVMCVSSLLQFLLSFDKLTWSLVKSARCGLLLSGWVASRM